MTENQWQNLAWISGIMFKADMNGQVLWEVAVDYMKQFPKAVKCPFCGLSEGIKIFSINEKSDTGIRFNCTSEICLAQPYPISFSINNFNKWIVMDSKRRLTPKKIVVKV